MIVLLMGVSGAGKTKVGSALALELGWEFADADDYHPVANVEKMRMGIPLTDADREPWLESLRALIMAWTAAGKNAVLACSALKKRYRDQLRASPNVIFVLLRGSRSRIAEQLKNRRGHYFDPKLLESQFADLEEPELPADSFVVQVQADPRELVSEIKIKLGQQKN